MSTPFAAPVPRVPRSRRDNLFQTGLQTGEKRASAGWVLSVQEDTCTVRVLDEELTGVIPLGDMPPVGAIVEVEARRDLLVIPTWFEGPPPWETLPLVTRVLVNPGRLIPHDLDFVSADYTVEMRAVAEWEVNKAVFYTGPALYDIAAVWDCIWAHTFTADDATGGTFWNTPPTTASWSGSGTCNAPTGPVGGSYFTPLSVGWDAAASASQCVALTESEATWLDYNHVLTTLIDTLGPSAGHPDPIPPAGFTLEWEDPLPTVTKIEAAITEATADAATNTGKVYCTKFGGDYGSEFGPNDPDVGGWLFGTAAPGGAILPGYTGGVPPWTDITSEIETTGKTWFLIVSDVIHDQARKWGSGLPGGAVDTHIGEYRAHVELAFRFTIRPSRYKFVPE